MTQQSIRLKRFFCDSVRMQPYSFIIIIIIFCCTIIFFRFCTTFSLLFINYFLLHGNSFEEDFIYCVYKTDFYRFSFKQIISVVLHIYK